MARLDFPEEARAPKGVQEKKAQYQKENAKVNPDFL
jgi:hypothetical protein